MAADIARAKEADLVLYLGLSLPAGGAPSAVQLYLDTGLEEAKNYLEEQAAKLPGINTSTIVKSTTSHGIVDVAEEQGADLIIMGSHGRSGVSRWILGSVTENVVQSSKLPVLVVYKR